MRKLIYILLFIPVWLSGQDTFWVSPRGDDANAGTDSSSTGAWETWGKAFNGTEVGAGDTVYFMGGTYNKVLSDGLSWWYYPTRGTQYGTGYNITRDGTSGDTIRYWAYPGQTPILDCYDAYDPANRLHYGIRANGVNYVHFKGLVIQNVNQPTGWGDGTGINDAQATGVDISGEGIKFENCTFRHIWGQGLNIGGATAPK